MTAPLPPEPVLLESVSRGDDALELWHWPGLDRYRVVSHGKRAVTTTHASEIEARAVYRMVREIMGLAR